MEGEKKVAVVTGGNRGVGLAVVRALAEAEPEKMVVVMGARDPEAGARACEGLKMDNVVVQQLDVQDPTSIARLATWLQSQFGGLDILVNNAGTSGTHMDKEALEKYNLTPKQFDIEASKKVLSNDHELSENCMDINYYGAKRMIEALSPLFKASSTGAHIINVSSRVGQLRPDAVLSKAQELEWAQQMLNPQAIEVPTRQVLDAWVDELPPTDCFTRVLMVVIANHVIANHEGYKPSMGERALSRDSK